MSGPKKRRWLWVPVLVLAAVVIAGAVMLPRRSDQPATAGASSIPDKPLGVGARGRIEPEDGVIVVAAPYFGGRPSLIKELRVKEGDRVRAGQIIAVLDGWQTLEKSVRQSEADAEVARTRLAQTKAGAKQADIDGLKMEIARWESEYEIAASDFRRYEKLRDNQIISPYDFDQKKLALDRTRRTLDGAREHLKSLEDVRKEDLDVRSAELSSALAQVDRANADLERMIVRAPSDGKILKIHAHPGEEAGPQGILELGKTGRMYAVAEVYESDISRVHVGQKAVVSGDLLASRTEKLEGTVVQIGDRITKSELLPTDPADFADTRVVKVKIELKNGESVASLIDGKVDVVIQVQ